MSAGTRRPNVVLITCHDLGRHLAVYGRRTVRTPATDRLAGDGVVFANAFCTSPGCSPSRAALATGRYPHENGVLGLAHWPFGWDLHLEERHLARILRGAGYTTALFGLQHVTIRPEHEWIDQLGFDHRFTEIRAPDVAASVDRYVSAADPDRPMYIEINFFEPHRPFDRFGAEADDSLGTDVPPYLPDRPELRADVAALQGAIRVMDTAVGRILAALERTGLDRSSIVVFTTDHGLAMPRAKGTLFDAGIEVALLMRWPDGGLVGGRRLDALVSNVDIVPTVADLAGVAPESAVSGCSFAGALRGATTSSGRDVIFAEKTYHETYEPLRCVRSRSHKLIARFDTGALGGTPSDIMRTPAFLAAFDEVAEDLGQRFAPFELFDMGEDPLERVNVASAPDYSDVERELKRRLWSWMHETDDPLLRGAVASPAHWTVLDGLAASADAAGGPGGGGNRP